MLVNEDKFLTQVARELLDDRNIVVTRVRTARGSGGENITIYKKIGGEVLFLEARHKAAAVVLGEVVEGADGAGQEATSQRAV